MVVYNSSSDRDWTVWEPQRKQPKDGESVKAVYDHIASNVVKIRSKFYEENLPSFDPDKIQAMLGQFGLKMNFGTFHVEYKSDFKPLELNYDICYIRHGKTEGNTEPRIFQGFCDYWENQLNETGKQQAIQAASQMEEKLRSDFRPDLIISSPLGRAVETCQAFYKYHPEIPMRIDDGAREQQFGCWDNKQVRHMPDTDVCHLFYLDQNALVKAPEPHIGPNGVQYEAENFVDVIIRQAEFLLRWNNAPEIRSCSGRAKVLIYGHSMAGAAVSILLGHGKPVDSEGGLGFDGKYIMPNATPTMLIAKQPEI